jgi:hypothetical protein
MAAKEEPHTGLYSDEEVLKVLGLTPESIPDDRPGALLGVVPNGETRPLAAVLKAVGLDGNRLGGGLETGVGKAHFLLRQLSPSYWLSCGVDDRGPERRVYGVRVERFPPKSSRANGFTSANWRDEPPPTKLPSGFGHPAWR